MKTCIPEQCLNSGEAATKISIGEKFAIAIFLFTCVQAAFLQPRVYLILGERANLFTGLLCAVSLLAAVIHCKNRLNCGTRLEIAVSGVLVILIAFSSALSSTPVQSSFRGFVIAASGLGGFWCSRLLLVGTTRRELFMWFCMALLAVMIGLAVTGYLMAGNLDHFLDANPHPVAARMLLLSFAPITLLIVGPQLWMMLGLLTLGLSYALFYLSSLKSAMLIPVVMAFAAFGLGALSLRRLLWLLVPLVLILPCFFYSLPKVKVGLEYEPAFYRAESYPFSWHIVAKHPFLGIGPWAPRDSYLDDYQVKYPYLTNEKFAPPVKQLVTSENNYLTFMVDLGLPFFVLYTFSVVALFWRLGPLVRRKELTNFPPPLALFLAIGAALLHFLVFDGLFHPQVSWFFHLLLGLVPSQHTKLNSAG